MPFHRSRRDFAKQAALVTASGYLLPAAEPAYVTAETSSGRVRGAEVDGVRIFKGIPYGASTAGVNRFMPPVDPAKWTGLRDALAFGQSAPQRDPGAAPPTSALNVQRRQCPQKAKIA